MDPAQDSLTGWRRIGDVADASGVSVDAVRFYERRGLLSPRGRTHSGYRMYGDDAVARIRDLKALQTLGLSLDEIGVVFQQTGDAPVACPHADPALEAVVARLTAKIDELSALREQASAQLGNCRSGACAEGGSCLT